MSQINLNNFLNDILEFESGIELKKRKWYINNFQNHVISFPRVTSPGKLFRNYETGEIYKDTVTVKEYFDKLGVLTEYNKNDISCLKKMQYRVINPWGFIGYQLGESILMTLGYYTPERVHTKANGKSIIVDRYYAKILNNNIWKHKKKEQLIKYNCNEGYVLSTDINRWKGNFTGKNNISNINDLFNSRNQDKVMLDIMLYNLNSIKKLLKENRTGFDIIKNILLILNKSNFTTYFSLSSIFAAAHLCGSTGTANYLIKKLISKDETGTTITQYINNFSDYSFSELDIKNKLNNT